MKPELKTEELPLPNFGPKPDTDLNKYKVRYLKANLDDPGDRTELEIIETKGIKGDNEVVLLSVDKFACMDRYYIVLKYMEKTDD